MTLQVPSRPQQHHHRNILNLEAEVRAHPTGSASLEFDLVNQFIETDVPDKVRRQAHWYRIRVRNRGTVQARDRTLRLEGVADTPTGIAPGALAVTGAGGAKSDIAVDGVVEFDIGYCFENAEPVECYLSTWPQAQLVRFAGRPEVSVRFTAQATRAPWGLELVTL